MSSADAFILVYDVTDSSTFDEARVIRDQIHETKVRRTICLNIHFMVYLQTLIDSPNNDRLQLLFPSLLLVIKSIYWKTNRMQER